MLKRLIISGTFLFFMLAANSQDVIFFRDSTTVNAKVMEVTDYTVIYKKNSTEDEKSYQINKNSIASIIYEDGRQESFEINVQSAVKQNNTIVLDDKKTTPPVEKSQKKGGVVIKAGLAFPLGKFAATPDNIKGEYGLFGGNAEYQEFGNAGLSYMVGLKATIPFTKFGWGVFIGIDLIISTLNKNTTRLQEEAFTREVEDIWSSSFVQSFDNKNFKNGYIKNNLFFSVPIMAGVNYTYKLNDKIQFFGEAGIGCNVLKSTTLEGNATFEFDGKTYELSECYEWTEVATTFAFQAGVGAVFFNMLSIDIHYLGLGNGAMNYKYKRITPTSENSSTNGTTKYKMSMFALTLGISI